MSERTEKGPGQTTNRASAMPEVNPGAVSAERRPNAIITRSAAAVTPGQRQSMIAEAAYYLALQRNLEPGHEVQDWLRAERQIEAALAYEKQPRHP